MITIPIQRHFKYINNLSIKIYLSLTALSLYLPSGPTVWITCLAGRSYPPDSLASPTRQPPRRTHSSSRHQPAPA